MHVLSFYSLNYLIWWKIKQLKNGLLNLASSIKLKSLPLPSFLVTLRKKKPLLIAQLFHQKTNLLVLKSKSYLCCSCPISYSKESRSSCDQIGPMFIISLKTWKNGAFFWKICIKNIPYWNVWKIRSAAKVFHINRGLFRLRVFRIRDFTVVLVLKHYLNANSAKIWSSIIHFWFVYSANPVI